MSLKQLKYLTGSREVPNTTSWGARHWRPHKQHPPRRFWKISWIISQHNYHLENDNAKPTLQWLGRHHGDESRLLPRKEPPATQSLAEDFCCVSQGCQVSHWDRAMSSNEDWWFRTYFETLTSDGEAGKGFGGWGSCEHFLAIFPFSVATASFCGGFKTSMLLFFCQVVSPPICRWNKPRGVLSLLLFLNGANHQI